MKATTWEELVSDSEWEADLLKVVHTITKLGTVL